MCEKEGSSAWVGRQGGILPFLMTWLPPAGDEPMRPEAKGDPVRAADPNRLAPMGQPRIPEPDHEQLSG